MYVKPAGAIKSNGIKPSAGTMTAKLKKTFQLSLADNKMEFASAGPTTLFRIAEKVMRDIVTLHELAITSVIKCGM